MNSILTITDEAPTHDMATLESVKLDLNITNNAEDARLSSWIRQASGMIEGYLGRTIALETVSETFRPGTMPKERVVVLERFPVISVASITENGVTLATDDYELDAENGLVLRLKDGLQTFWAKAKIVVAYTAGYELLDGLPFEIERACLTLVKMLRSHANRDPMAKHVEIPGVRVVDYWIGQIGNGAIPPDIASILDGYLDERV